MLDAVIAREPDLARHVRAVMRAAEEPIRFVEVAQLPLDDREDVLGVAESGFVGRRLGDRQRSDGAVARRVERRFLDVRAGDPADELCRLGGAHRRRPAAWTRRGACLLWPAFPLERLPARRDAIEPRRLSDGGTFVRRDGAADLKTLMARCSGARAPVGVRSHQRRTRAGRASNSTRAPLPIVRRPERAVSSVSLPDRR
jgi:hypothetical protein